MTVRGVVTAEAGRLGTPTLLAIADGTGGIVVKLPDGIAGLARGRILVVRGTLVDPYGQLELRPALASVVLDGSGSLPLAIDLGPAGPDESTEGRLVRAIGSVAGKPVKATSGDVWFYLETAAGTRIRVMADGSSGVTPISIKVGAEYRISGIAGQRATRKGALDGYRIWLRDPADLVLISDPTPSSAPSAGASSSPTPTPKPSKKPTDVVPPVVSIAAAINIRDRDTVIEAIVTAGAMLLDATGRRIVVQDATAAIEVLLPKDATAPGIGVRVKIVGRVGTAYGAPRFRAAALERLGTAAPPAAIRVHGDLTAAHIWRLVAVAGRIDDVKKLGERWRAEVVVGAQRVVVVGQPAAAIPMTSIVEGRAIEVTGIVRPAYPSASDKRASLLPRSLADVRVAAASAPTTPLGGGAVTGTGAGAGVGAIAAGSGAGDVDTGASSGTDQDIADADLALLEDVLGTVVRVGGLVVDVDETGFRLDDGTAVGSVVLVGEAVEWLPLIEPGDAINVTGRVERAEDDRLVVIVDDPSAIVLGGELAAPPTAPEPSDGSAAPSPAVGARANVAGFGDDLAWLPGPGAGLLSIVLIGLASITVTLFRRRHSRRLLAGRIAVRLAAVTGQPPPSIG